MDLLATKLLTAAILFVTTIAFSFSPYLMVLRGMGASAGQSASTRRRDTIIAYLNSLAGGVFLGTLLLHMLSEGSEEFDEYKELTGLETDYPVYNLVVGAGFFLVAFVEVIAHTHLHRNDGSAHSSSEQAINIDINKAAQNENGDTSQADFFEETKLTEPILQTSAQSYGSVMRSDDLQNQVGHDSQTESRHPVLNGNQDLAYDEKDPSRPVKVNGSLSEKVTTTPNNNHDHRNNDVDHTTSSSDALPQDNLRAFLILTALSFHTIFDGLAIGLQTSAAEVWSVFAAVVIHKSVISFCLGLEFFQSNVGKSWKAMVLLFLFAVISPIGIGVAIAVTEGGIDEVAEHLTSSLLQGLASGTFMYVTFLEILCLCLGHKAGSKLGYLLFVLIGFCIMAATKLLDAD